LSFRWFVLENNIKSDMFLGRFIYSGEF
jgi:hypothetical protein